MTSRLSDEARELVDEGKRDLRPSAADRARIALALQAKLDQPDASIAELNDGARRSVDGSGRAPWLGKAAMWTGGVVVLVAATVYLRRPADPDLPPQEVNFPPVLSQPTFEPAVEQASSGVQSGVGETMVATIVPTPAPSVRATSRAVPGDRLAEEAALLAEAEKAFHAGNFNRTLTLTSEHRVKFPTGLLRRERVHLRVQSLCGLGRYAEADKENARGKKPGAVASNVCKQAP